VREEKGIDATICIASRCPRMCWQSALNVYWMFRGKILFVDCVKSNMQEVPNDCPFYLEQALSDEND